MRRHATAWKRTGTGRVLPVLVLALVSVTAAALDRREGIPRFEAGPPANSMREPPRAMAGDAKDRIVRNLERKYNAKVLKGPKEVEIEGRKVLVFTLLDDKKGKVKEVRVDAQTGEEL
jgi:hypothetical protein